MTLESVSTDHLRQVLAEVDDAAATERLMAALTYKEIDEVTQEEYHKADERAQDAWQEGVKKSEIIWTTNTRS